MLIVGDDEAEAGTVAVRRHGEGDLGAVEVDEFARAGRSAHSERRPSLAILAGR